MKRNRLFWIGLMIVLTVSLNVFGEDKIDLKLNYQTGQTYVQRMTMDQTLTEKVSGQTVEIKQTVRMDVGQEVLAVDEAGNAEIRYTYRSIYFKQTSSMGNFEYDSANPSDVQAGPAQGFAALAGSQFTVRMTPKGQVLEIKGLNEMFDAMIKKLNLPDGANTDLLKKLCSEENLKESLSQSSTAYPEQPLGIGDTWTQTLNLNAGFPLTMESTFKLKQRKNGRALVDCNVRIRSNPNAEPLTMGTTTLSYTLAGKQNGTMEIDETTGLVAKADFKQDFSGTVTLNMESGNMVIPLEVKSTIRCELVP